MLLPINNRKFSDYFFWIELENALLKYGFSNIHYDNFIKIFPLDKDSPIKKQYLGANHANFVTKQLRKVIMKRSKLRNDFLKDINEASQSTYRKQRSLCVTFLRKAKLEPNLEFLKFRTKIYNRQQKILEIS